MRGGGGNKGLPEEEVEEDVEEKMKEEEEGVGGRESRHRVGREGGRGMMRGGE